MEDEQIVELYFNRCELAISETEKKYGKYCNYIAYQILGNEQDSMEVTNDAFLKAWNTIPPNRPKPLKAYVGMLSRQLAIDREKHDKAQKRGGAFAVLEELSECIPSSSTDEAPENMIALREALDRFVHSLAPKAQRIFIRRYWYSSSVAEISDEYGISVSGVTVILTRTRKKLKKFLEGEGFFV